MTVVLEILNGPSAGGRIELHPGQILRVGRTEVANEAFAGDEYMSGVHFELECRADGLVMRDMSSRNGTMVNGRRVNEALLAQGDRIMAGETEFRVCLEDETVQPGATPGPVAKMSATLSLVEASWLPPLTPASSKLVDMLRTQFQPLYAILDAARDPLVLALLLQSKEQYQSLYEGTEGVKIAAVAPYLVRLPEDSSLLEVVVRTGWGKSWGVFLTSTSPFPEIRKHLRHFLMVKLPEGKQVYFRFYDPRVLRVYLPTCLPEEFDQIFGPVKHYLMEDENAAALLRFSNAGRGVGTKEMPLAPALQRELKSGLDRHNPRN